MKKPKKNEIEVRESEEKDQDGKNKIERFRGASFDCYPRQDWWGIRKNNK